MRACGRLKNGQKCGELYEGSGSYCKDCRNKYQREYYAQRRDHPMRARTTELTVGCDACGVGLRSNTVATIEDPRLTRNFTFCATCKGVVIYLAQTIEEAAQEFIIDAVLEVANLQNSDTRDSPMRMVPAAQALRQVGIERPSTANTSSNTSSTYPYELASSLPIGKYVAPSAEEMAARAARMEAEIDANLSLAKRVGVEPEVVEKPYVPYVPTILQQGNFVACGACDNEARPGKKYCTNFAAHEKEMDYGPGHLDI